MLLTAGFVLYILAALAISTYAYIAGGRSERQAMTVFIVGGLATEAASRFGNAWSRPEYGIILVDTAMLVGFIAVAHQSKRFWPLWASAFHLVGLMTHFAIMAQPSIVREVYAIAQPFWAFPVMISILIGTREFQLNMDRAR